MQKLYTVQIMLLQDFSICVGCPVTTQFQKDMAIAMSQEAVILGVLFLAHTVSIAPMTYFKPSCIIGIVTEYHIIPLYKC